MSYSEVITKKRLDVVHNPLVAPLLTTVCLFSATFLELGHRMANNCNIPIINRLYLHSNLKLSKNHNNKKGYTTFVEAKISSNNTMTEIQEIIAKLRQFNQEREWDQFHNGKDLAIALSIESSELLEAFLWKAPEDAKKEKIKEELADVLNYAFQMADKYGFDIKEIMLDKVERNAKKYPVEKAKGVATKYTEL